MATAQHRTQMGKLVSIADARTRRAFAAVTAAQQQLDTARQALDQRAARLIDAEQSVTLAELELRRDPANAQHRLWLSHCHTARDTAQIARDDAIASCDEAMAHLAQAQKACQRQQVRQDHVEGAARRLKQDASRETERRLEDDQQGSGRHIPAAHFA
ncbi:MAG: hypothetical protein ABL928_02130 [Sphingorhabdus sp.]